MTPLERVREKVVTVVPFIKETAHESTGNNLRCRNCGSPDTYENRNTCPNGKVRTIHLADVLLARLEPKYKELWNWEKERVLREYGSPVVERWNLRADSLDSQSEETIAWLDKVLGV